MQVSGYTFPTNLPHDELPELFDTYQRTILKLIRTELLSPIEYPMIDAPSDKEEKCNLCFMTTTNSPLNEFDTCCVGKMYFCTLCLLNHPDFDREKLTLKCPHCKKPIKLNYKKTLEKFKKSRVFFSKPLASQWYEKEDLTRKKPISKLYVTEPRMYVTDDDDVFFQHEPVDNPLQSGTHNIIQTGIVSAIYTPSKTKKEKLDSPPLDAETLKHIEKQFEEREKGQTNTKTTSLASEFYKKIKPEVLQIFEAYDVEIPDFLPPDVINDIDIELIDTKETALAMIESAANFLYDNIY
ncbi:hypothetical protein EIN_346650 [Entamoeba invadens IP1]|uniref:RING-type domain-containing protein n=1 Tax=Entamoeba invadens IP1 TaxID=370355 RepID=L7FJW6_ENTIV|nr:hypothetical protein EIN_346650 [Entamoeba invadens IP1]ELP84018.1 hypothetical protein EIN_346650 [Entamoeba invadens IP1]|eukprot:XP_004183364.1 hypothetical protein EIN_346650 [Entamoeba invadens IP1]